MSNTLWQQALEYHRQEPFGKLKVVATKPLSTQRDLALAYSPGVAAACEAIVKDPNEAAQMTARGNLVAVITNGTAVLGLGNIGPLAAKPVMEGKAVLFKKFAGIDVFDIEINEPDPKKLVDIIASLEPTFGGINLEDIKAPECFEVEQELGKRMKIPVFHDDQHGTAIIVAAALINGLRLVDKDIGAVTMVVSGAGAAALACLDLLQGFGLNKENVTIIDQAGVVYCGRSVKMDPFKGRYARDTKLRTLEEAIVGADVFLGLSAAEVLTKAMVKTMADKPIIFALANPTPEILPEKVREVRQDAIIATGRSDYPNQVNNALCFPYIFRGALDVGATVINEEMKKACVLALANLAMAEPSDVVAAAYGGTNYRFGADYIIPKPFDPRLITEVATAVAKAAMDTGVATRPLTNIEAYRQKLSELVFRSGFMMRPLFQGARKDKMRIVYAEGEEERILRAVQSVVDDGLAEPILVGRRDVVSKRIEKLGLRLRVEHDFMLVDPQSDRRYAEYWRAYHRLMERKGVTPEYAKMVLRTNTSVIGALMVHREEADGLLCGPVGRYDRHLMHIMDIIGLAPGVDVPAALSAIALDEGPFFVCDTYVNADPTAEQLANITRLAAEQVRQFGMAPKVALVSHSNFGTAQTPSAHKMRQTLAILQRDCPSLEVEGEMHADAALNAELRQRIFPNSKLTGAANLLVMPNLDAANISFNMMKTLSDGWVGPILLGAGAPAHILTPSVSVRGILNMTVLAAVGAKSRQKEKAE